MIMRHVIENARPDPADGATRPSLWAFPWTLGLGSLKPITGSLACGSIHFWLTSNLIDDSTTSPHAVLERDCSQLQHNTLSCIPSIGKILASDQDASYTCQILLATWA
jgi:hypothetical protein